MKIENPTLDQRALLAAGWAPRQLGNEIRWVGPRGETTSVGTTEAGALRSLNQMRKPERRWRCSYCKTPMATKKVQTATGVDHYPRRHKNMAGGLCPGVRELAIPIKTQG